MSTNKAIDNAVASVRMEGYQIDNDSIKLCKKLLDNEIDMAQYITLIKQKSGAFNEL